MIENEGGGACSYQKAELFSRSSNYLGSYSFVKYTATWKLSWDLEMGGYKYLHSTYIVLS